MKLLECSANISLIFYFFSVIIMASKAYEKGYRFERYIFRKLTESGFYCISSRGSHGVFDIIAIFCGKIFGIQCKINGYLSKSELSKIHLIAHVHEIIPLLAYKHGRKTIIKRLDMGETYPLKTFISHVLTEKI